MSTCRCALLVMSIYLPRSSGYIHYNIIIADVLYLMIRVRWKIQQRHQNYKCREMRRDITWFNIAQSRPWTFTGLRWCEAINDMLSPSYIGYGTHCAQSTPRTMLGAACVPIRASPTGPNQGVARMGSEWVSWLVSWQAATGAVTTVKVLIV